MKEPVRICRFAISAVAFTLTNQGSAHCTSTTASVSSGSVSTATEESARVFE